MSRVHLYSYRALFVVMSLWLVAAMPLPALAQNPIQFPELTGRVVDNADILSPEQEAELTTKLEALEQGTTDQLVVVTLPTLNDYDIADYGYQLGRHWGIGQSEANNGALLIVAPNDRKVRIEVGYGLEGILTDAYSALTIQNHILPPFRNGDYYSGINAGVDQLILQMTADPEEAAARAAEMAAQAQEGKGDIRGILIIIVGLFGVIFVIGSVAGAATAGSGRRMQGAADGAGAVLWTTAQILASIAANSGSGGGRGGGGGFGGGGGGFGGGGASGGW